MEFLELPKFFIMLAITISRLLRSVQQPYSKNKKLFDIGIPTYTIISYIKNVSY